MANDEPADGGGGGGDTDSASLTDINFSAFLSDSSAIEGVDFQAASGINVIRVAQAVIASIVFAVAFGVNSLIDAVATVYARLIDGIGNFVGVELIDATLGVGVAAIDGVWTFTLNEFGFLAFPIALVSILGTFYVASIGIDAAGEVLS